MGRKRSRGILDDEIQEYFPAGDDLALAQEEPLFKKRTPRVPRRILIVCALIAVLLITGGVYLYVSEQTRLAEERAAIALAEEQALRKLQQEQAEKYDAIMNSDVLLAGIQVDGIDVGGMSKAEAAASIETKLAEQAPKGALTLTYGEQTFTYDLSKLTATSNLSDILTQALAAARSDDMAAALAKAAEIEQTGISYAVTSQYDYEPLKLYIAELAAQLDTPMKNAAIGTVDTENHTVSITEPITGVTVQQDVLLSTIITAVQNGATQSPIQIPVTEVAPTVLSEHLSMIEVSAETSFKGSTDNRIYNIKKGANLMNGTVLAPGEVFSANSILGVRTYGNGWKEANAYVGGTTDPQAGGGVCQLSSTLYNAVVKADLEVVFRRNHSMPVSYISKGLDATINSVGNVIDFKFKNNTDTDIVVFAWTSGKSLFFKIVRSAFDTTEYDQIKLTAKHISTISPAGEMEIIFDETLAPGTEEIDVPTSDGSIYQSYKVFYKNGEEVRSEKLAQSTYQAFNGVKRVGPELIVDPGVVITPVPDPGVVDPGTVTDPAAGVVPAV